MIHDYFDTHCDTFFKIHRDGSGLLCGKNDITLEKLSDYGRRWQFFALYSQPALCVDEAYENAKSTYLTFLSEVDKNRNEVMFCKTFADAKQANHVQKLAAFLSIENSTSLKGDVSILDEFYEKGVRLASLTHGMDNLYGCGNATTDDKGLTDLGKKFIREFENRGILLDVSHLSFQSFWDAVSISTRPIVASHSSSYAICKHPRNLTDKQFKAILSSKGYVGINIYSPFLTEREICVIDDVLLHIEHFLSLGGEHNIGLGGDLDGIDKMPNEISGVQDIYKIADEMLKRNYPEHLVRGIMFENGYCFVERMLS